MANGRLSILKSRGSDGDQHSEYPQLSPYSDTDNSPDEPLPQRMSQSIAELHEHNCDDDDGAAAAANEGNIAGVSSVALRQWSSRGTLE